MSANLQVNIFGGDRKTFRPGPRLLVTAVDPRRQQKRTAFVDTGQSVVFEDLKVFEESVGGYTVLVATKDHCDAGFNPVRVHADQTQTVDLMLLRRDADYVFHDFSDIQTRPALLSLLGGSAENFYESLATSKKQALASLLNITTALDLVNFPAHGGLPAGSPLASFKAIEGEPTQDRVFLWADTRLPAQVRAAASAGAGFSRFIRPPLQKKHAGATDNVKQVDFGESNLQFNYQETNVKTIGGTPCMLVEVDIDYFQDPLAHIFLEVVPNKLNGKIHGDQDPSALTDPRTVYGLRWIIGRRLNRAFEPPYVLN